MPNNWSNAQVLAQLDSGSHWSGSVITYAFPTTTAGIYDGQGEDSSFRPVPIAQQALFRQALQNWDDLIAPNFQETRSTTSNIEMAFTSSGIEYAHAYFPNIGSAWFKTGQDVSYATIGSYGFMTIMHELGHALGLNHMGNYNGSGTWTPSSFQDSIVLSLMSYFGPRGAAGLPSNEVMSADWAAANGTIYLPQTPMLNDVMAIQAIFGASTTTRTSDTIYGFSCNISGSTANIFNFDLNHNPILTIFDSGGIDTLNLSGWNSSSTISLEAGSYSSCNQMTNNIAIAYNTSIENATGGGGNDAITG
ncbi:MAG: hypothetical protein RL748_65, partial [Pseudomonadota bacterium]